MLKYFKVVLIQPKADGFIRVFDPHGNRYHMERSRYPRLRTKDVFRGRVVTDMRNGTETVVVDQIMTEEDKGLVESMFPKPVKQTRKSDV